MAALNDLTRPRPSNASHPGAPDVYAVIMCGGSGTRLWPVSRPGRPKQFAELGSERSLFEQTVARVRALEGFRKLVVVAGYDQRGWVGQQLGEADDQVVILEPTGRDSGPAVAVAAEYVARENPAGVMVIVASDHHVPDTAAFADVVKAATLAARGGRIVTLGIAPREPSPAYGYIRPLDAEATVSEVAAFVEKPGIDVARRYIAEGYLWNSGNFIARADTLLDEFREHVPDVAHAVIGALDGATTSSDGIALSASFGDIRKVSIDYAVMERTRRASVVRADLDWSDLGAWDAIRAVLPRDGEGNAIVGPAQVSETAGSLVFNATQRLVAVHAMNEVSVIATDDAVLVSPLAAAQDVKAVVNALAAARRPEVDMPRPTIELAEEADALGAWLDATALPLWWTHGFDHEGGIWREELDHDGRPTARPARARVQGRQTQVYADAAARGWAGPGQAATAAGLRALDHYRGGNGYLRTLVDRDGTVLDGTVFLYDQTFAMLALAHAAPSMPDAEARALTLLDAIEARFERVGDGLREAGRDPFQSNAHMHLLEACLGWVEAEGSERWATLADRVAGLARTRLIDADGIVREFFDADWNPAPGEHGRRMEPGHQFEWAYLMMRHAALAQDPASDRTARLLFATGARGIEPWRSLAVDAMDVDLKRLTGHARLWPQAEWLRASLEMLRATPEDEAMRDQAKAAVTALRRYLDTPVAGLWHDKCTAEGAMTAEPAPASSLYHIAGAIRQLQDVRALL